MRNSLDEMLRAEAEQYGHTLRPRPVREVRARGDRRRRRAAAGTALLALTVLAGSGAAAYALAGSPGSSPGPVTPQRSSRPSVSPSALAPTTRPSPRASGIAARPAGAPPGVVAVTSAGALVVLDPVTGATVRTLVAGGVFGDEISVSPGGSTVYYAAKRGCGAEIYAVPLTGGPSTAIAAGAQPAISPDGTRLAFVQEPFASEGQPQYVTCPLPPAPPVSLVIRDLATGTQTSYPRPPGVSGALVYPISHLSWSPGGRRLAVSLGEVQDNLGWNLVILNPASARYYMSGSYPFQGYVPVGGNQRGYYREGVFLPTGRLLVNRVCCLGLPAPVTSSLIEEVSTSGVPVHLVAVGFTNRAHSSFAATGKWVLYLSGTDLFMSRNGRRPALLTSGLVAAAWIPPGQS
jgi:WD40-like Beta Propeller Repeat